VSNRYFRRKKLKILGENFDRLPALCAIGWTSEEGSEANTEFAFTPTTQKNFTRRYDE
jgi:hypothetical protein